LRAQTSGNTNFPNLFIRVQKVSFFKNTESTWVKKTKNVKVVEGKNLYDGKAQAWSGTYEE
jgi:hypothetical protein